MASQEILVGQVWRDLDPRMNRTVTVERTGITSGLVYVVSSAGARSRINPRQFHNNPNRRRGFALVQEPQA